MNGFIADLSPKGSLHYMWLTMGPAAAADEVLEFSLSFIIFL